ncbi:MAG: hypothetical protein GX175_01995 [Halanaerobiaceae bacterium]|jgi:hypothetical protein|nr:hypothetical protein [Halanaerobiaceae bacterium]
MNDEMGKISEMDVNSMDFLLFLILILLLIGNQNTFNSYFQLFDKEINRLNQILGAFKATAEGLKGAVSTKIEF